MYGKKANASQKPKVVFKIIGPPLSVYRLKTSTWITSGVSATALLVCPVWLQSPATDLSLTVESTGVSRAPNMQ